MPCFLFVFRACFVFTSIVSPALVLDFDCIVTQFTVEPDEELGEGEGENCSLHSGDSDILYSDLETPSDPVTMPPPQRQGRVGSDEENLY